MPSNAKVLLSERQLKQLLRELKPKYVIDKVQGNIEGEREVAPPENVEDEITSGGSFATQYLYFKSPIEEKLKGLASAKDNSLYNEAWAAVTGVRRQVSDTTKFLIPAAYTGLDTWIAETIAGNPESLQLDIEKARSSKGLPSSVEVDVFGSFITAAGPHVVIDASSVTKIAKYCAKALSAPVTVGNVADVQTLLLFLAGKQQGMDRVFGNGWWEGHFKSLVTLAKSVDPTLPFETSQLIKSSGLGLVCTINGTVFYDAIEYFKNIMAAQRIGFVGYEAVTKGVGKFEMSFEGLWGWVKENETFNVSVTKYFKEPTFSDLILKRIPGKINVQNKRLAQLKETYPQFDELYDYIIVRNGETLAALSSMEEILSVTRTLGRVSPKETLTAPTKRKQLQESRNRSTYNRVLKLLTEDFSGKQSNNLKIGDSNTDSWLNSLKMSQQVTDGAGNDLLANGSTDLTSGTSKFSIFKAGKDDPIASEAFTGGDANNEASEAFVKLLVDNELLKYIVFDNNLALANKSEHEENNRSILWWIPTEKEFAFYIEVDSFGSFINPFEWPSYTSAIVDKLSSYLSNESSTLGGIDSSDGGLYTIHFGDPDGLYDGYKTEMTAAEDLTKEKADTKSSSTGSPGAKGGGQKNKIMQIETLVNQYISSHKLSNDLVMSIDGNWIASDDDDGWGQMVKHTLGSNGSHPAKGKSTSLDTIATNWLKGGPLIGYAGNLTGALEFVQAAMSATVHTDDKTLKPTVKTQRKPGIINVSISGRLAKNKNIETIKQNLKQAAYGALPKGKIVAGDMTIKINTGLGGRIKPDFSNLQDGFASNAFKKEVNRIISGPGMLKTRGTINITIPTGDYSVLKEVNEFYDIVRSILLKEKIQFQGPQLSKLGKKKVSGNENYDGGDYPKENVNLVIQALRNAGIVNKHFIKGVLTVVAKESNFKPKEEIGYSNTSNSRIKEVFDGNQIKCGDHSGKMFYTLSDTEITELKSSNEGFFNALYGNRIGNGCENGDGWLYRGRGFNQLTGRANYKKAGYESNPDEVNNPADAAKVVVDYMTSRGGNRINLVKSDIEGVYLASDLNSGGIKRSARQNAMARLSHFDDL